MSVYRDDSRQQFVVTVRGTADVTSIIDDVGVEPEYWDPLNLGGADANKTAPFDEDKDYFVPGKWKQIAENCLHLLMFKGIMQQIQDEPEYRIVVTGHSLGAGTSALLALLLEQWVRQKETGQRVHWCGFEPPGCSMSKALSRWTQEAGWMSVVCAYDWVPRLSLRNVEELRELALRKLATCDRSKFQLMLLLVAGIMDRLPLCRCMRKCLSAPFQFFAGGCLTQSNCWAYKVEPVDLPSCPPDFPFMCPPGDIVYLKPVKTTWLWNFVQKDVEWVAVWADPEDIQSESLILDRRAIDLHVPWVYEHAVNCASTGFETKAPSVHQMAFTPRHGGRRK